MAQLSSLTRQHVPKPKLQSVRLYFLTALQMTAAQRVYHERKEERSDNNQTREQAKIRYVLETDELNQERSFLVVI